MMNETIEGTDLELIVFGMDEPACESSHLNVTGHHCSVSVVAKAVTGCGTQALWCQSAYTAWQENAHGWCTCDIPVDGCWRVVPV